FRPALCGAFGEVRVPLRARRARRRRHGRVRHAAPRDRPGPRGRAPLYRPLLRRRRGARLGLLQPRRRAGAAGGDRARRGARRRPHLRARHHQEDAAPGVERGRRRSDRDGGPGAGDLHADQRFPAGLRGLRREAQARLRRRLMDRFAHYGWPFFEPRHAALAREADAWARENLAHAHGAGADAICRRLVADLGCAGYLHRCVGEAPDVRSIAILREVLAYHAGLADFAFVMQGLGSGPISLAGSDALKKKYLPKTAAGEAIAAFALSEPEAGSDVQAISTQARREGTAWRLDGTKTWISNGGIADYYVVFAKAEEGISAFVVDAAEVDATERIEIVAPHPMAVVKLSSARAELLGEAGQGFKLAMRNLDVFRPTVGAAALGFARRALDEALERSRARNLFGQRLSDF